MLLSLGLPYSPDEESEGLEVSCERRLLDAELVCDEFFLCPTLELSGPGLDDCFTFIPL